MGDMHTNIRDVLEGNLNKIIFTLSLPVMFSNLLQSFYSLADTFWVAKLGSYAIAALTISFPIIFSFISLGSGVDTGSSVFSSHRVGKLYKARKDYKEEVGHIFAQTLILLILIYLLLMAVGFPTLPFILKLMHAEPKVFQSALSYLRVIFAGSIFLFIFFAIDSAMRGLGNTRTPMKLVLASVILNAVLDPLFIFGIGVPKMGVVGAAVATLIARAVVNLFALFKMCRGDYGIPVKLKYFKPDFKVLRQILKLSVPASFGMISLSLGMLIFTSIVSRFGTVVVASYGIVMRLFSIARIPCMGISAAVSIIVAQNFGAKNIRRIFDSLHQSVKIGSVIMILLIVPLFIFSKQVILIFTSDPQIVKLSSQFLKIISPFFIIMLIRTTLTGFFNGVKKTYLSMIINLANSFVFKIPLAYLLAFKLDLGVLGIWWSYPAMMVATLLLSLIIYFLVKREILRAVEGSRTPV